MEEAKPQILLWTVPECPFRVTLPATVLNEIRILAVEAFYSVPRGGVEVGGAFFGVREPGAIHIQAYRQIPCEYSTGPSFTLSVRDQLGLSGVLDQAHADPDLAGMTLLGWFHSHTRSELFLSPADLELYKEFFHERWQIALVLRPANLQPTRAGFFFRDQLGTLKSDSPVQEFTLEPPNYGLVALEAHDQIPAALPPLKTRVEPPAAPTAPADQPAFARLAAAGSMFSRGPAVALAPAPVIVPEPPPAPQAATIIPAAAVNGSGAMVADAPVTRTPDFAPQPLPKLELKPELEPPAMIGLRSFDLAETAAREKRKTGWIWALAIILLLSLGGGAAFLKWGRIMKPVDLGLETYDINGAFLIRWDRNSGAILGASRATLEIEDGGEKIPVELSPGELAAGGYGYMRRTGQILVHMKVDGPIPLEEYSNFKSARASGSQPAESSEMPNDLTRALEEKEHLKTELINESMQSSELRLQVKSLRRQLAEERARK